MTGLLTLNDTETTNASEKIPKLSNGMMSQPPFIATQRLLQLRCPPGEELEYLSPERFRLHRMKQRGERVDDVETRELQLDAWAGAWEEVDDRQQTLGDFEGHVCLTVGGGVGKSKAAQQAAYLRHKLHRDQLAMLLDVSDLPRNSADEYLEGDNPKLVQSFRGSEAMKDHSRRRVLRTIQDKIRNGQFTLIVDGLDQIDMEHEDQARQVIQHLATFLAQHTRVRCMVAGRPWAVQKFMKILMAKTGSWTFLQIDEFNEDECKTYLGDRWNDVQELEADLMSVPRFLERLRKMPSERLKKLRSGADVYWESLGPMLTQGCDRQAKKMTVERAVLLLSLLGFQMTKQKKWVRIPPGREFKEFRMNAWETGKVELQLEGISDFPSFTEALKDLASLNVGLKHLLIDNRELNEIHWQDRTLQAFCAAIWVTKFASESDRDWLQQNLFLRSDNATQDVREMWRFACEMPVTGEVFTDVRMVSEVDTYVQSMAMLLAPAGGVSGVRSTEMIYRCWPTMLRLGGFLTGGYDEEDIHKATLVAQTVAKECSRGAAMKDGTSVLSTDGRIAVLDFLREYPTICQGAKGKDAAAIAHDFEKGFRPIPALGGEDKLDFWMSAEGWLGENSGEVERSSVAEPFELAEVPVTIGLYGLFDAEQYKRIRKDFTPRAEDDSVRPHPRCPVTAVDWFDAWAAATWLHAYLPTEHEWEFACRAQNFSADDQQPPGAQLRFCGEEELKRFAWFDNDDGTTMPVGKLRESPFGLYDMYGNVWEWTASRFYGRAQQESRRRSGSRVLRGGSFVYDAAGCRSACRNFRLPAYSNDYYGFRVARARKP